MARGKYRRPLGNTNSIVRVKSAKLKGVIWRVADCLDMNYQEAFEIIINTALELDKPFSQVLDDVFDSFRLS